MTTRELQPLTRREVEQTGFCLGPADRERLFALFDQLDSLAADATHLMLSRDAAREDADLLRGKLDDACRQRDDLCARLKEQMARRPTDGEMVEATLRAHLPSEPGCTLCADTGVAMVPRGPVLSSPGPCPRCGSVDCREMCRGGLLDGEQCAKPKGHSGDHANSQGSWPRSAP